MLSSDYPNIACSYTNIANIFQRKSDSVRALESYQKALAIFQRLYGKDHLDVASYYNNMSAVHQNEKKILESTELSSNSIEYSSETITRIFSRKILLLMIMHNFFLVN
jgi:tetratricopeptide (TPR) repeat protein